MYSPPFQGGESVQHVCVLPPSIFAFSLHLLSSLNYLNLFSKTISAGNNNNCFSFFYPQQPHIRTQKKLSAIPKKDKLRHIAFP